MNVMAASSRTERKRELGSRPDHVAARDLRGAEAARPKLARALAARRSGGRQIRPGAAPDRRRWPAGGGRPDTDRAAWRRARRHAAGDAGRFDGGARSRHREAWKGPDPG